VKKLIILLLIAISFSSNAQIQENFADGDFISNPAWTGDSANFEINGNNQLHLNAPATADESIIVTATNAAVDGYWEFFVDLDFNPSASNRAYVYIVSDQSDLKGGLDGYYVLIGSTNDEISLYKQNGATSTKIIDGVDGTVATAPKVKIKVTRDLIGNFELFSDTTANFNNYLSEGTVFDNDVMESNYFGFLCDYTSTRSDKFIFDSIDVTAQVFVDIFSPILTDLDVKSLTSLELSFSEDLDVSTVQNLVNYSVNNAIGSPQSAVYNNVNKTVLLLFANEFVGGVNYDLTINNVEDLNLNSLDTIVSFELENAYFFESIIFNEILADETPTFGLPTFEFIEFKNLQNDTLFTEGWFLSDFTDTTYFNADTILPNEYVIVGKTTAESFYAGFGKTFGLTSFISLNKSEDKLTLFNKYGEVLDSLHYFDDWFAGQLASDGTDKVDGGWSLSRISENYPCAESGNWAPSNDVIGGSPGTINNVDVILGSVAPAFVSATFVNDTTIQLMFNQEVLEGNDIGNYQLSSSGSDFIEVYQINSVTNSGNSYFLTLEESASPSIIYALSVLSIQNCAGAPMIENSIDVFFVKVPEVGDLLINEILFNPYSGAYDYIEVYNTTTQALNLNGFSIVEYDVDYEDTIIDASTTYSQDFIIPPGAHFTFTEDTESVFLNYIVDKPEWLFDLGIPSYADNEGVVGLVYNDSIVLDKLHYFSRWNFELLDSDNGVSLERISTAGETQNDSNWASAAKSFGFGTPTAVNSQTFPEITQEDLISVTPEVFTPNQDGYKDFTLINYTLDEPGFVANVAIYDIVGRKIKVIALNETIGVEGFWKWDGTNYNNEKAKIGIYIVLVDLFDLDGKKKHFEEKVVLGAQF
jgi:hypothetical protein